MAIQAGDKMPSGVFGKMTEAGPGAVSTDELFSGKKVVLVSVPGAFTPTCSAKSAGDRDSAPFTCAARNNIIITVKRPSERECLEKIFKIFWY